MISIRRANCPLHLKTSRSATAWNHPTVVKALHEMQNGKCCYCEKQIPLKGRLKEVEHYKPKSKYKNDINNWENLLLACSQCNGKKSNHFPLLLTEGVDQGIIICKKISRDGNIIELLIDPSDNNIDPEDHIGFLVDDKEPLFIGRPIPLNNSYRGEKTIEITGIDDDFYVGNRQLYFVNVVMAFYQNILRAHYNGGDAEKEGANRAFESLMSSSSSVEYVGFTRAFAREKKLDENFGLTIPLGK